MKRNYHRYFYASKLSVRDCFHELELLNSLLLLKILRMIPEVIYCRDSYRSARQLQGMMLAAAEARTNSQWAVWMIWRRRN